MGKVFDELSAEGDYSELCVDSWEGVSLYENKQLTNYADLRIRITNCDPNNLENIICESEEAREEFISQIFIQLDLIDENVNFNSNTKKQL